MIGKNKNRLAILEKLGIESLNAMQEEAQLVISSNQEVVLLSPTGTGKTLAFLLPVLAELNPELEEVQALILVPSRELAIQIEQVARDMGSGFKVNAVYGGRSGSKDKIDLKHSPALLIGTPGRIADHIRRDNISTDFVKTLVLDEFDKSLEVGFEAEMREIVESLSFLKKKILTSATQKTAIPDFVGLRNPKKINFLGEASNQLEVKIVEATRKDKLDTLLQLLKQVGSGNGIIFCNFKDTIQFVSDFLNDWDVSHGCFYGGLEQVDRERALIKFRNGTHRLLIATDLAARGIDVPEMDFIIHYQLPLKKDEFTHRNGRTARMNSNGTAYVLKHREERTADFLRGYETLELKSGGKIEPAKWSTLYVTGGRKDKISKGDVAGLFFKQGGLNKDELGNIELKQDCVFVAVPALKAENLANELNNVRLKKKKVRITLLN